MTRQEFAMIKAQTQEDAIKALEKGRDFGIRSLKMSLDWMYNEVANGNVSEVEFDVYEGYVNSLLATITC